MQIFNSLSPFAKSGIFLSSGVIIFGFSDNLTLLISDQVSVGQFHFSRSLIACVTILILAYFTQQKVLPTAWRPAIARTAFNTLAMLLYFSVIPLMPIAEAGAGLFTSPIFVLLFSFLFFKERVNHRQIFSFFLGLLGVFFILGANLSKITYYHIFPVMAGASYALGAIITNRYCSKESSLALSFLFFISIGISGIIITSWLTLNPIDENIVVKAPFFFLGWQSTNMFYWNIILVTGLCAVIAISFLVKAYQISSPSYSAIYEYVYLISAGFFGWLLWGTLPSIWSFLGIIAIVFAGINILFSNPAARKGP